MLHFHAYCANIDRNVIFKDEVSSMVDLFTLENESLCVLTYGPTSKNFDFNYLFRVEHKGKISMVTTRKKTQMEPYCIRSLEEALQILWRGLGMVKILPFNFLYIFNLEKLLGHFLNCVKVDFKI